MSGKTETDTPLTDALLAKMAELSQADERTMRLVSQSAIWEHARSLERQLADSVAKEDVARAVFNNDYMWEDLAALGITPDLLEGGAE